MEEITINLENFTEEEREQLSQLLNKVKEREKNIRWKPRKGQNYWVITQFNEVESEKWENDFYDNAYFEFQNCFKTKEEAEFEVKCRKIFIDLQNYANECGAFDKYNPRKDKWHLGYDLEQKEVYVNVCFASFFPEVFFPSEETALEAINKFGAENLKKYYFRIEEEEED